MSPSIFLIAAQLASIQPAPGDTPLSAIDSPPVEDRTVPPRTELDVQLPAEITLADAAEQASLIRAAGGDDAIVVTARPASPPGDPMQALNVESFKVVQSIDRAVTGPVARGYKKAVPSPVRSGVRNMLRNLGEPVVFVNYLLQLKVGKSAETLGRFAVNSTIGAAGLFDVAKKRPFNLPYRINGFAYTLGYYGVKPGAYMYLPLIGPTTVRDLAGRIADVSLLPLAVGKPFDKWPFVVPMTAIRLIDERAEAEDEMRLLRDGSVDSYSSVRTHYLGQRQAEIDALRR